MTEIFNYSKKNLFLLIHYYLYFILFSHRIPYRIKKWWFPLYTWSISVSTVNAWRLCQSVTGQKSPFLDFMKELVIDMFDTHSSPPIKKRISQVSSNLRFDGLEHWIVSMDESNRAKGCNCRKCTLDSNRNLKSMFICEKCKVPLCTYCFKDHLQFFLNIYIYLFSQVVPLNQSIKALFLFSNSFSRY